jgi:hypothetical protein
MVEPLPNPAEPEPNRLRQEVRSQKPEARMLANPSTDLEVRFSAKGLRTSANTGCASATRKCPARKMQNPNIEVLIAGVGIPQSVWIGGVEAGLFLLNACPAVPRGSVLLLPRTPWPATAALLTDSTDAFPSPTSSLTDFPATAAFACPAGTVSAPIRRTMLSNTRRARRLSPGSSRQCRPGSRWAAGATFPKKPSYTVSVILKG